MQKSGKIFTYIGFTQVLEHFSHLPFRELAEIDFLVSANFCTPRQDEDSYTLAPLSKPSTNSPPIDHTKVLLHQRSACYRYQKFGVTISAQL